MRRHWKDSARSCIFFPPALKSLCDSPDQRARPERATYSAGLLRTAMLVWMLTGGASCDAFGAFIDNRRVAETVSRLAAGLGYAPYMNDDRQYVLPGIDLLRLEMERLPSECLQNALEKAFCTVLSGGCLRQLEIDGKLLLAIDGTDGFSSSMEIKRLLSRTSGNTKRYYAKMLVASVVAPGVGGGLPAGAQSIENSGDYDSCGSAKQKQACEQATLPVLLKRLNAYCPLNRCILLLDGLYMNGVVIRLLNGYGCGYLITLKDDALDNFHCAVEANLAEHGCEYTCEDRECTGGREVVLKYDISWLNGLQYDFGGTHTPPVNYLSVIVRKYEDGVRRDMMKFAWVTNVSLSSGMIPLIQMTARRRWGIETQNCGQKHQGMNLTHKYDSRGNAPANFMYLAQMADLIRKILLYSDIYDRKAKDAESNPVPGTKKVSARAKKNKAAQEETVNKVNEKEMFAQEENAQEQTVQ